MRHLRSVDSEDYCEPRFRWRNFVDIVSIKLDGPPGYGADIDVEVEFAAYPGDTEPRELVSIKWPIYDTTVGRVVKETKDFPDFLIPYLRDCIDLDALETDFED